jgi:hypothetical protein
LLKYYSYERKNTTQKVFNKPVGHCLSELVFVDLLTKEAYFKKKYIVFFGKMRKIEPEQNLFGPEPWIKQTSKQS